MAYTGISGSLLGSAAKTNPAPVMAPAEPGHIRGALEVIAILTQRAADVANMAENVRLALLGSNEPISNVKEMGEAPEPSALFPAIQLRLQALSRHLDRAEKELHVLSRM